MRLEKHHLLYFGPLTVLIEWVALILGLLYLHHFDLNNAISSVTTASWPLPLLFGGTLTIVAVTYSLFAVSLRSYSRHIPVVAIIAGIAFIITGWVPYTGTDGVNNIVHNTASFVAVVGYIAIIWLLRDHPKKRVSQTTRLTYKLLLVGICAASISMYATHRYIALMQLYLLFIIQAWTVFIVWHELRESGQ